MQEDTNTMTIIQNILARMELDVQNQFTEENIDNFLTEILNKLQQENAINFNTTITVYVANSKAIRTVIKIENDNISNIIVDNATTKDEIKYIFNIVIGDITNVEDISSALQSGELNGIQLEIEKTASDLEISHNEVLKIQINGELNSFSAQTVLGRVNNNSIYNTSNITIANSYNNVVNISYDKTINATTEPMDIMELNDTNSVIINNYSLEQLEPFFSIASTTFYFTFSEGGLFDILSEIERNSVVYESEKEQQLKTYYSERLSTIEARLKIGMTPYENNEQYLEEFKNYIESDPTFNGSKVINENNNQLRLETKEGYIFAITNDGINEIFEFDSEFTEINMQ